MNAHHDAHGRCLSCGYPAHRYPFGWQHAGSGMFSCSLLVPLASCCDAHASEGPACPDGGKCHHACTDGCFRVECCEPLSGVFPDNQWPKVDRRHEVRP